MASASAWLSGRRTTKAGSPPSSRTSRATSSSSSLLPDASSTLPPSAVSASAVARPNVPDAPVMMATLSLTSNSDSGLRSGSEIMINSFKRCHHPRKRMIQQSGRMGLRSIVTFWVYWMPAFAGMTRSLPGFEPKRLLRIDHRDDAQRAAFAFGPAPRKGEEGAAPAGDLVDLAADILDPRNAVAHHDLVRRLPVRKVLDDVAPGLGLVLEVEMRLRRPGPVRAQERAERMIVRLHVDADQLDAALHQPFGGLLVEAGRVGEIIRVVAVLPVTAGVDHHDVALADLRLGLFQILRRDHAPFALRDRHRDAGAEEAPQRIAGNARLVLGNMDRRVHVGAAMHDAFELLHQNAVLGVEFEHPHIEIGPRRPLRHAVTPWMTEVEEFEAVVCFACITSLARAAAFQASLAFRIEHGDEADHASVALVPFPWKALERDALAGELVDVASDILDGRNAGREQCPMRRIPVGEIGDRLAPGRLFVFRQQIFDLRAVAVRTERRRQRMIDARGVAADEFYAFLGEPFGSMSAQARRVAEIRLAVGIFSVPAGVDDDDVAAPDRRLGALQVGWLDQLPFLLRNRQHHAAAEERVERQIADRGGAWNEMDRRVDVGRGVKDRGDLVRHHALLGMVRDALELDLLVAREDRRIHAPAMAELVIFEPADGIDDGRHFAPSERARAVSSQQQRSGRSVSRWNRACQTAAAT